MRTIENRCLGCDAPGYPCKAPFCHRLRVEVIYCDECEAEIGDRFFFTVNGKEYCPKCYYKFFEEENVEEEEE
jgi:hypothetical protein